MRKIAYMFIALLTALLVSSWAAAPALAKVHTWVDDQGVLHFSQKRSSEPASKKSRTSGAQENEPATNAPAGAHPAPLPQGKGPLFMWKVAGERTFAYLMGSIHFAPKSIYPLDPRIDAAFEQCRILAVESDIEGKEAQVQAMTMKWGLYPQGDSLDKHISKRTENKLKEMGALNPMFMRFKPWLLAMQLQSQYIMRQGYDQSQGVDRYFLRRARQEGKQIKELEDAADTLKVFIEAAEEDEDEYLYYSLSELERIDEVLPKLVKQWQAGSAEAMYDLIYSEINKRPQFKEFGKKLFDERNVKMARKVESYLRRGTPSFVVVGAGHLVGPMGIPALLGKKGFEVQQVGVE